MIRRLLTLALLISLSGCTGVDYLSTFRTDLTQRPFDEMPAIASFDVDALSEQYPGEPAYYFDFEQTLEHVFLIPESDRWIYVEDIRRQYVILDADEETFTTFRVNLAPRERLDGIMLRSTSPSGEVLTYSEDDLIREVDDGRVVYKFAYPAVERGTVIEESFRTNRELAKDYTPPLYIDAPLQLYVPVKNFAFQYVFPTNWALKIKQVGPRQIPPYELDRNSYDGRTVVTFKGRDLAGFPDEPYSPFFKEIASYLEMQVTEIANPYFPGDKPLYETEKSWEELTKRYGEYAFDRGRRFREVEEQAQSLARGLESDSAKVASIVSWIQNNIEVGGDADDLASVMRERKGNSLLQTSLAQAMLAEVGLDADFIIIHPANEGYFDRSFISGTQFTTPAVRVKSADRQYVVFPFVEGLPITYIPEFYQGADAIVIRPEGGAEFIQVPTQDAESYAVDEDYAVEIDEDGIIRVEETKTLRGIAAYELRKSFEDLSDEEKEEEVRELLTYNEGQIEDFEYEVQALDAYGQPLAFVLRYTIPDLVTVTPEEVIFRTGGLLSPASLSAFETKVTERQLPIRIYYDRITNKSIRISYPESWTLATELEDTAEQTRFGSVRGIYLMGEGEITAEQQIVLKESRASPTAYGALLQLTGSQSRLYVPTLVFTIDR